MWAEIPPTSCSRILFGYVPQIGKKANTLHPHSVSMKKVLLLVAEGFEMYEASVFIDVFGWNLLEGNKQTTLYSCSAQKTVSSAFSQTLVVDYLCDTVNVSDFDALAVPGGFEEFGFYANVSKPEYQNIIRAFYAAQKPIASVCTGALALGMTGILEGKKATTYNQNPVRLQMLAACGAQVIEEPIVVDGNIITSWNPHTAMKVAFLLLEMLEGKENADRLYALMGF
jgi:4-methyl-5(b-hydroxyethyl)-thiazole monophosphate biosynthesis